MEDSGNSQYPEFCGKLGLGEDVMEEGKVLLDKILALGIAPDTASKGPQVWWACAVFVVALERQLESADGSSTTSAGGLKLTSVLQAAGVRLNEFLDHLTLLTQKLQLSEAVNQVTASIKQDQTFTCTIFEKYQQLWQNRDRLSVEGPILLDTDPVTPTVFALGWCLYALCKKKFNQEGLVESFHMMLACLDFSIRHGKTHASAEQGGGGASVGPSQAKDSSDRQMESMEEDAIAALTLMSGVGKGEVAGALSKESKVKMDVLEADAQKVRDYVGSMVTSGVLEVHTSSTQEDMHQDKDKDPLTGLFHPSVIASNLSKLRVEYSKAITNLISVDEQFVLTNGQEESGLYYPSSTPMKPSTRPNMLQPTPRTAPRQLFQDYAELSTAPPPTAPMGTPHKPPRPNTSTPQLGTPIRTPHRSLYGSYTSLHAQTPVTAAIDALQWIHTIESLPVDPSPRLIEHFRNATPDNPQATIEGRIRTVMEQIQLASDEHIPSLMPDGSPSTRAKGGARDDSVPRARRLGTGLYYKVLQTMLDRESERLKSKDHGALFRHDTFHRALLACSVEVVLKALSLVTLAFPRILELFDIQAFDFYKVIESFVRCAPSLPYLLRQHLHQLEDQVLESIAWSKTQPGLSGDQQPAIFALISEAKASGHWPVACLVSDTLPTVDARQPLARPKPCVGEAANGGTPGQRKARTSLDFFFRKVLKLGAERINALARRLEVGNANTDQIWTVFKHCMVEHVDLLMPNRHLDHAILCSLYAICKVNKVQPEVTFKRIIENYRKLAPMNSSPLVVIRDIELLKGKRGDIIRFYNDVYIPTLKNYILQFQRHHEQLMAAQQVQSVEAATVLATGIGTCPSSPPPTQRAGSSNSVPESPLISPIPITSPMRSPTRISSSNVFLTTASPNRPQGVMYREMTPRTRVLYAFGESPAKDLDLINRAVNKRPAPLTATNGAAGFQPSVAVPSPGLLGRSHKRLKM